MGDVDDDVDVSDKEILEALATRDVEDLIENGFISGKGCQYLLGGTVSFWRIHGKAWTKL